ncbi:hypothetical protein SUGI_1108460 [Cryptomeria japonica]|nr:hypothetical protein SUGI_1108460 [Cryptomeria japonica]
MGFVKSEADANLYYLVVGGEILILVLYVDDLFLTGSLGLIEECKRDLATEFEMKDLGLMHYFLGMEVWQTNGEIFLGQGKYCFEILKRFRMEDCKAMSTPMITNWRKVDTSKEKDVDPTLYRYSRGEGIRLMGYTDADWAGSTTDKRSTSGCCFSLGLGVVSWFSRKQKSVALSSAESEYIAASMATCEAIWLRKLLVALFVHGALVIYPRKGRSYPFPKPHAEIPIVLGQWWNSDPEAVEMQSILTGAAPNISNGFTIDGQPGDLYPFSKSGTSKISVEQGRTYLLRIVNAAVNNHLFFKIASHNLTVVAVDACYTKPYTTDIMLISPGQTADVLLTADQPLAKYYIAAKAYTTQAIGFFDNTTTTAVLSYSITKPSFARATIDEKLFITVGLSLFPCRTNLTTNCQGPNNTRLTASLNNVSFVLSDIAIFQAYYFGVNGVFTTDFPSNPPVVFNYTGDDIPKSLWAPITSTKVYMLDYNSTVEAVFQGTNIFQPDDHPMHLHGYDFCIVGEGFGNYNAETDPLTFNLVDLPQRNTVGVPVSGWSAIRFKADNPGVWFMHCHFDDHVTWGLNMVFVVKNGPGYLASLEPPPNDLPRC